MDNTDLKFSAKAVQKRRTKFHNELAAIREPCSDSLKFYVQIEEGQNM